MHADEETGETGETGERTDSPREPRVEREEREKEREREGEREREIAGRLVGTGLVAIVMACAMVPMCQPPQQLSPLLHCC